ncbi:hypothetical protein VaNZ11_002078, partial [Volvox africanus]
MATLSGAAPDSIQARLASLRYAEKEYWNSRYKSQPCEFDWFYGYNALRRIVRTFVKRNKPVLQVGCGNSNFQEGMARDGYQVLNTDISEVVIDQMRIKHKDLPNLQYVVSDCRNMPEILDCQFGSVVDKGTVDALLCSKDAADNIHNMFREISRVLVPGGVFLLITLGGPAQRLSLVNRQEFDWSVQVCLVRRVAADKYAPSAPGRAIPLNDTTKPLSYIGPLEVKPDGTVVGLPEPFEPSSYFYTYVCRRSPLLLRGDNRTGKAGKVRLPDGWKATVRAVAKVVGGGLQLPQGILGRGRIVKMTSRTNFERLLREKELREVERFRIPAAEGGALPQLTWEQELEREQLRNPNTHPDHRQSGNCGNQQQDADLDLDLNLDPSSEQHQGAFNNHLTNNRKHPTATVVARPPKTAAAGLVTVMMTSAATATQDRATVLSGRLFPSFGFGGDGAVAAEDGGDGGRAIWSSVASEGDCGGCSCCGSYGAPSGSG